MSESVVNVYVKDGDEDAFYAKIPYDFLARTRKIGGKWMQGLKVWRFPLDMDIWEQFERAFHDVTIEASVEFKIALHNRKTRLKKFARAKEIAVTDAPIDFGVEGVSLNGVNPLFNYQRHGVKCGLDVGDGFLIGDVMGLGKGQPLDELVYTPHGVVTIGSLRVGDEVIGRDGKPTRVTGVFPQGLRNVYRLTFSDGCSVECDENHLWSVVHRSTPDNSMVVSTMELLDDFKGGDLAVPIANPIDFKNKNPVALDPYVLGTFLGVSAMDDDCDNSKTSNSGTLFKVYAKKKSSDKVGISYDYKYSSLTTRLALLQGLMDNNSDCVLDSNQNLEHVDFPTVYRQLAEDVQEMIQTVGGLATIRENIEGGRVVYHVQITMSHYWMSIFRRKHNHFLYSSINSETLRTIDKIEYVGMKETVCISVASKDKLYLTRNAIVTHNTIQSIAIAIERKNRGEIDSCLVVCPASLKYNWLDEVKKFTNETAMVIGHKAKNKEEREKQWIADGCFFKIVNYELVARDLYAMPKKTDNRIVSHRTVLKSFDMVVFDECFAYDAPVLLSDGKTMPIGKIVDNKLPVRVMSYNFTTGGFEVKPVVRWFNNGVKQMIKLTTSLGTVEVTENHIFYDLRGNPVIAGMLHIGDKVACFDQYHHRLSEAVVVAVTAGRHANTYNIEVQDNHNYICGGSLVSNCQYMKHHSSARTQAARQLQAKYRIGLSGTPIDGRLEEIHSIFQILKPGLFTNKQKFMERHAEYDWFGAVKGYRFIEEVRQKIEPYYLRRLKEVVLKDLPPKMFKDMRVELSDKNMKDYKRLIKGCTSITEEAQAIEVLIRARQFLDFPEIVGMRNNSDKYAVFKELLDELVLLNNEKVIVFSQYTTTIKYLVRNLEDEYKNIQVIDGSVPSQERVEICKRFNELPEYKVLIMSDAGCTGLNLQAASAVIHYSDNFSPAVMLQRGDRAHRATTKHTVTIYRFICNDTIEDHVRDILSRKMAVNNALLEEDCDEFAVGGLSALELMSCL